MIGRASTERATVWATTGDAPRTVGQAQLVGRRPLAVSEEERRSTRRSDDRDTPRVPVEKVSTVLAAGVTEARVHGRLDTDAGRRRGTSRVQTRVNRHIGTRNRHHSTRHEARTKRRCLRCTTATRLFHCSSPYNRAQTPATGPVVALSKDVVSIKRPPPTRGHPVRRRTTQPPIALYPLSTDGSPRRARWSGQGLETSRSKIEKGASRAPSHERSSRTFSRSESSPRRRLATSLMP